MSFTEYLIKQSYRDDKVGDLGRDVAIDKKRPPDGIRAWRQHLKDHTACEGAYDALEKAWVEYKIARVLQLSRQ